MSDISTLTPGTRQFIEALAARLEARGRETIDTVPEDEDILDTPYFDTPFNWIAEEAHELGSTTRGTTVRHVIEAMGLSAFVCSGSGRLIEGELAKRGLAFGIGSERIGETITAEALAEKVRGVITVLPQQH